MSRSNPNSSNPPQENAAMPYNPEPSSTEDEARNKRIATLMAIEGVEGVGTGQDAIGNENIQVYVRDAEAEKRLPSVMDGLPVQAQITGPISALKP